MQMIPLGKKISKPVKCESGSPIHIQYDGFYDDFGRVKLREVGKINLYDEIQSHADSCDIHVIMARYKNGDVEALSQRQGFYGDILNMPKTYAEALNNMHELERQFYRMDPEVRDKFGNSFEQFLAASNQSDFLDRIGIKAEKAVVEKVEKAVKEEVAVES